MLTRRHGIVTVDLETRQVLPDRLVRGEHARYVSLAEQLVELYQTGRGRRRGELHQAAARILSADPQCPPRRVEAFCKLLDDASTYRRVTTRRAAELRRAVFGLAAPQHPLVERSDRLFVHDERRVKDDIAAQLGYDWPELDRELYADYPDFHYLAEFSGFPDAESLLSRYNVAQLQVALFDAVHLTIWARSDFKTILRYAKLARLMHTILPGPGGSYRIRLDGPASILRPTGRYGAALARFLPALIACRDWTMHAVIRTRKLRCDLSLDLSSDDGLRSHLPPPQEFDSQVEERFAKEWGEVRDGWRLAREAEVLWRGQKAFLPDFAIQHDDGRRVLLEIIGFWTTSYLQAKLRTLQCFPDYKVLLAVGQSASSQAPQLAADAIVYRRFLPVEPVLQRLRSFEVPSN